MNEVMSQHALNRALAARQLLEQSAMSVPEAIECLVVMRPNDELRTRLSDSSWKTQSRLFRDPEVGGPITTPC
jgi:hypothetical protein